MSIIEYTLGDQLSLPLNTYETATFESFNNVALPAPTLTVNGTVANGRRLEIHRACQYTITAPNGTYRQRVTLYTVNLDGCTVSSDCPVAHHGMLIADVQPLSVDGEPLTHMLVDFPLFCVYKGVAEGTNVGAPLLGFRTHAMSDQEMSDLIRDAVQAACGSFHWNGHVADNSIYYYLSVFEGYVWFNHIEDRFEFPYAKRLITTGDSVEVHFNQRNDRLYFNMPNFLPNEPVAEAVTQPDTDVDVQALQSTVDSQRASIERLEAMCNKARQTAISYTRENGGCNDGKHDFLFDLGLWPDHDRAEILELVGIYESRDYEVTFTATVSGTVTVTMSPNDVDDFGTYELRELADTADIEAALIETIRYNAVEIDDVIEVEES